MKLYSLMLLLEHTGYSEKCVFLIQRLTFSLLNDINLLNNEQSRLAR